MEENKINYMAESMNSNIMVVLIACLCAFSTFFTSFSTPISVLICVIFIYIGLKGDYINLISIYLMLTFWDERLYLIGTIPLVTVLKICLVGLLVVFYTRSKLSICQTDMVVLFCFSIYATISFALDQNFGGFSMVLDLIIIVTLATILFDDESAMELFWKRVFFAIFVSGTACVLVGYYEYIFDINMKTVYLSGGETYKRFRGVVGVDRFHFIGCVGMIYPLFYLKKNSVKIPVILLFTISTLLTMSITAVISLVVFWTLYLFLNSEREGWLKTIIIIAVLLIVVAWVWQNGSGISFVDALFQRIKKVLSLAQTGDYAGATTNRTELWNDYMSIYNNFPIIKQIFGSGHLNQYELGGLTLYSHNCYIDFLLYFGMVGCACVAAKIIQSIQSKKSRSVIYKQCLLMKVSCLIMGLSVSAMTADYWLIFLLI